MNPNFFDLAKRKKRDILAELLLGKSTEGIIGQKELNALNRIIEGPPSNKAPVRINNQPPKTNKFTTVDKKNQKTKIVASANKNTQSTKIVASANKKTQSTKKKKTHYLSQEISEKLDRTQMTIRSLVPEKLRFRISKSLIVNQTLAMILQEFEAKEKNSRLMRTIIRKT